MGRRKNSENRFEEGREIDTLDRVDNRFEGPDEFSDDEIRQNLQMSYKDNQWFNPKRKPADVVYQWGRESVLGMLDPQSLSERARLGWTPVPLSRHPEFATDDRIDGGAARRAGIIRHRGDILFERHVKHDAIAKEIDERRNIECLQSVKNVEKSVGILPKSAANKVTLSRERGRETTFA